MRTNKQVDSIPKEVKEFEKKSRLEICQLIHPELSRFWNYKFFGFSKNISNLDIRNNVCSEMVIDIFFHEMSLISQEKKMYFSYDISGNSFGNNKASFNLHFPHLGNNDFSFGTNLCAKINGNEILIIIEPNATERGLSFNLNSYKEALEVIKKICAEDQTPLNHSIIQIIDKVWVNYRNRETALSSIELILRQKGIKHQSFPENLSVRIVYFVPIINKTISTRIYYREFNDNPNVLHEIEKYAKS